MKKALWNELSDEQSEKVVGGVGAGPTPGAGIAGWFGGMGADGNAAAGAQGLIGAGFSPPGEQMEPGASGLNVTVPGDKS